MEKAVLQDHLALAEKHLVEAQGVVTKQRQLIGELERHGHDTQTARTLLLEFEHTLALHRHGRDRIRAELAEKASS